MTFVRENHVRLLGQSLMVLLPDAVKLRIQNHQTRAHTKCRYIVSCMLITLMPLLSTSLTAAEAVVFEPDPGTVFIFSNNRVEQFVSSDGDRQIWRTRAGREYWRSTNPLEPVRRWQIGDLSGHRELFGQSNQLWPPKPGMSDRFRVMTTVVNNHRTHRSVQGWYCKVLQTTHLDVPAGRFDVVPIRCETYSLDTMRPLQHRTWWWAPALGHYVKREYQSLADGEISEHRLCAALPERRANRARVNSLLETACD